MNHSPILAFCLHFFFFAANGQGMHTGKINFRDTNAVLDTSKLERAVFDDEKKLTAAEVNCLDSLVNVYQKKSSTEILIMTVDKQAAAPVATQPLFDQYANLYFVTMGTGNSVNNRGIGIFFTARFHLIRIEVGEGLTGKLTEQETKRIIDTFITPSFKIAEYFKGLYKGLQEIVRTLE